MRVENPKARELLSGVGAPGAGSGLEPHNGVNDPWRWSDLFNGWISNPVDVSWEAGAVIKPFNPPAYASPGGAAGVFTVYLGTGTNPRDIQTTSVFELAPVTAFTVTGGVVTYYLSSEVTLADAGQGTAFLLWDLAPLEGGAPIPGYTGTNTDVLPAETRTVIDILNDVGFSDRSDFTIVEPSYEWDDTTIGSPGDFYIDINSPSQDLYGPRTTTSWGATPRAPLVNALRSPDGTAYRLVVANDGTLSAEPI